MAPRFNESSIEVISEETSVNKINNSSESYPFTWTDLSDDEKKERKRIYTAEGPWCVSPKASMLVRNSSFFYKEKMKFIIKLMHLDLKLI